MEKERKRKKKARGRNERNESSGDPSLGQSSKEDRSSSPEDATCLEHTSACALQVCNEAKSGRRNSWERGVDEGHNLPVTNVQNFGANQSFAPVQTAARTETEAQTLETVDSSSRATAADGSDNEESTVQATSNNQCEASVEDQNSDHLLTESKEKNESGDGCLKLPDIKPSQAKKKEEKKEKTVKREDETATALAPAAGPSSKLGKADEASPTVGEVAGTILGATSCMPENDGISKNRETSEGTERKPNLTIHEDLTTMDDSFAEPPEHTEPSPSAPGKFGKEMAVTGEASGNAFPTEKCGVLPDVPIGDGSAVTSVEETEEEDRLIKPQSGEECGYASSAPGPAGETDRGQTDEDRKRFSKEASFPESHEEEKNSLRIYKLMYGVGLRTLRKLFRDVHPAWSDKPTDAAGLDRGVMKLQKHEENVFKSGNIEEWDFSLLTTVLLYSKKSAREMSKQPARKNALETLKEHRNKLIGHPTKDKMTTTEFSHFWPIIRNAVQTLGADSDDIQEILTDEIQASGEHYRDMFLAELTKNSYHGDQLSRIETKVDMLLAPKDSSDSYEQVPDQESQKWDEWINFRRSVRDFNSSQNQYILIADAQLEEDTKNFSVLRRVPWKMILDLDHQSEEKGFYREFTSNEDQSSLINMITPSELRKCTNANLPRQIDVHKTQWLFVNGRESDTDKGPQTFADWEATSVKQINKLFLCCSDPEKFDKSKPLICLVLPFRNENWKFLNVILDRLRENFPIDEFDMSFVSLAHHENLSRIPESYQVHMHDLSADVLFKGMSQLFDLSALQGYRMPSSQAEIPAFLTQQQHLYLDEHLEVLYDGCEELPQDPIKLKEASDEHRKSFMSGNWISFMSLHLSHDAKRELGNDIRIHIQRLLDQRLKHSVIVEIRHLPGTGGSTIARRVLWDLHKSFPCAFARPNAFPNNEDAWLDNLVSRIKTLGDICNTSPLILVDGHVRTEGSTNKLVRALNNIGKRALLLRCQHGAKSGRGEHQSQRYHVHKVFTVNVKLQESIPDYDEFQSKYKDFIEESSDGKLDCSPCRVFHFPLMAMIEDFHPKLKEIVHSTVDQMKWWEQEVVVFVAFIQKYANQASPAKLIFEAFKKHINLLDGDKKSTTYDCIRSSFSEDVLNLMVPARPRRSFQRTSLSIKSSPERYTLQHPIVAEMVLEKSYQDQHRGLSDVAKRFLQFPIYGYEEFVPLLQDLFIHNTYGKQKMKFSLLFVDLQERDQKEAAAIFRQAAERTNDPHIFAHAARFHAKKKPPSFPEAKELIEKALSNEKRKPTLLDTKGVILHIEMQHMIQHGLVKDLETLEQLAERSLAPFRAARTFPPTYPNPLIGEVRVWLTCIEWIVKNVKGDSDKAFKFITCRAPPFFRTCIGDSYTLLDIVDRIVYSVPNLKDPEQTQTLANFARLNLMKTFNNGHQPRNGRRDHDDIIKACDDLCSSKTFPMSSKKELGRIRVHYLLSFQEEPLGQKYLQYLLGLLSDLVLNEKELSMAYHLMKVCVLVKGRQHFTLERGLQVTDLWQEAMVRNYLPYFFEMAICFLKILEGETLEYAVRYNKALRNCREKSQNHCKRTVSTHYVGKEGSGMSRLVTRNVLLQGETDYGAEVNKFWTKDSRRKLLECKGRIRARPGYRGKEQPFIELIQGNVELHVAKNVLGKAESDYTTGSLVYFVVSFNLNGPVANGITFEPSVDLEHDELDVLYP